LPITFFPGRDGEDNRRAAPPKAALLGRIGRDIGDLSREIAALAANRFGKQFATPRLPLPTRRGTKAAATPPPKHRPVQVQSPYISTSLAPLTRV
jgi:hypothetical protein